MTDTEPQTAGAKVLWHFAMSLDGFVAGPQHDMSWMTGFSVRPGLQAGYLETTGAVLAGRSGLDSAIGDARPYGGAWQGPIFVLTHHPEDAPAAEGITVLDCPVEEAVRIDEIDPHIAPILLGDGVRLYDNPGGVPVRLRRVGGSDPLAAVNVRYRPATPRRPRDRRPDSDRPVRR